MTIEDTPQEWTGMELRDTLNGASMELYSKGRILIDYCDGETIPVQDGPVIPSPDVVEDFVNQIKRTLAYMLRQLADSLDSRPLPGRTPETPMPAPQPGTNSEWEESSGATGDWSGE